MQHIGTIFSALLLLGASGVPGAAQQGPASADRPAYCAEYYGCIDSRPLSEAEARSSRGYPAPSPSQTDFALRNPRSPYGSGPEQPSPTDPSTGSLPSRATF
jgi:hypothetical protein